jgi:hypothetical protein
MKQFKATKKQIDKLKQYLNGKDSKSNNGRAEADRGSTQAVKR